MERRGLTEPLRVQDEMRTTLTYGINRRLFCRVAGACALCKACAVRTYRSKYGIVQPRDGPRSRIQPNTPAPSAETLTGRRGRLKVGPAAEVKRKNWYERSTVRGGTRPRGGARTAPTRNIRRPRGGRLRRRYLARPRHPAVDSSSSIRYDCTQPTHTVCADPICWP